MPQKNLAGLKNFLESKWNDSVSKQLNIYEKKVKDLVKDLDLKSRDAREKSREQLDAFTHQVKKTRTDLEKRIVTLVNQETKRLNVGLNELVSYLKSLSHSEKTQAAAKAAPKAKAATKKKSRATVLKASSVNKTKRPAVKTKSVKKSTKAPLSGEAKLGGANSSVSSSLSH